MKNSIIERVILIARDKNMSLRKLSDKIGFSYSTLNDYVTERRKTINSELLICLLSSFNDISAEWLMRGVGEMYCFDRNVSKNSSELAILIKEKDKRIEELKENISDLRELVSTLKKANISVEKNIVNVG